MIVSVDHNLEHAPESTSFLVDTKKLDDIENFKEEYGEELSKEELERIDEARKKIKKDLEKEEDVIGWGYEEEKSCEGFTFYELVEGAYESHPVRVMKNVTVFEE